MNFHSSPNDAENASRILRLRGKAITDHEHHIINRNGFSTVFGTYCLPGMTELVCGVVEEMCAEKRLLGSHSHCMTV